MKILYILVAGSFVLLCGCSGFMLQSGKKSYTTGAISKSVYRVSFSGDAYMDQSEAEKLAMQRACEIALTKGYTHFEVLTKSDQSETNMMEDLPRDYSTQPKPQPVSADGFVGPRNIVRPNIVLKIKCYKTKDAPKDAVDAQKYIDDNFPGLKFKK
jgi:hypothetical protein